MLGRTTYGLLAITFLISLVASDALLARRADLLPASVLLLSGSVIPLACAVVSIMACIELARLLRAGGANVNVGTTAAGCCAIVLVPWLSSGGVLDGWVDALSGEQLIGVVTAVVIIAVSINCLYRARRERALADVTATWFVIIYAGLLLSFITLLRCDSRFSGEQNAWVILVFLLVTKSSDIGAYFLGSAIGRHKLAPGISPGKSVEGFLGGILAAAAVSVFFFHLHGWSIQHGSYDDKPVRGLFLLSEATVLFDGMNQTQALVFGAVMSIAGQLGDLFESLLKRSAGTKDSGHLLPGFGGILDMIDSPIFAAPVAWFLLTHVWSVL